MSRASDITTPKFGQQVIIDLGPPILRVEVPGIFLRQEEYDPSRCFAILHEGTFDEVPEADRGNLTILVKFNKLSPRYLYHCIRLPRHGAAMEIKRLVQAEGLELMRPDIISKMDLLSGQSEIIRPTKSPSPATTVKRLVAA